MGVRFTGEWRRLSLILSASRFTPRLRKEVGRATALNARLVARGIRQRIRGGVGSPLAELTTGIKDSTKQLVDFGELFRAVATRQMDWNRAFAGILRTTRDGEDLLNLAWGLHEGVTIPVTGKMRVMFRVLADVASGRRSSSVLVGRARELYERAPNLAWRPLADSTTAIVIPSRPFIREAVDDQALLAQLAQNWQDAVARALLG